MKNGKSKEITSSLLGCLAIFFWGSTIAVSRSLTEKLDTFAAAASIFLLSGIVASILLALSSRKRKAIARLPRRYLIGCGLLFVLYMGSLYLAIGLARNRGQVIAVGIINYLWPSLTLALSIPVQKNRARWFLAPGMAMAFSGVVLASLDGIRWSWESFASSVKESSLPYLSALVAAVSWALYSNYSRRWGGEREGSGVPLFLLATGILLAGFWALFPGESRWTPAAAGELAFLALFPTLLAYLFWDRAMRRGNLVLVASLSYFTPLLSTLISCLYLGVPMSPALWGACALVMAGAALCNRAVRPAD